MDIEAHERRTRPCYVYARRKYRQEVDRRDDEVERREERPEDSHRFQVPSWNQVEFHVAGPNSETPVVETYGSNGGRQCADFDLVPGEWLAAVLRRQGNSLDAVRFVTNTGRQSQWYGNQSGGRDMPRLAAPAGQTIVGLRRPSGGCCPGIQDIVCVMSPRTSTPWRGFRLVPFGTRE